MDISEFTEAESNMCDLISEYQQYSDMNNDEESSSVESSTSDVRIPLKPRKKIFQTVKTTTKPIAATAPARSTVSRVPAKQASTVQPKKSLRNHKEPVKASSSPSKPEKKVKSKPITSKEILKDGSTPTTPLENFENYVAAVNPQSLIDATSSPASEKNLSTNKVE